MKLLILFGALLLSLLGMGRAATITSTIKSTKFSTVSSCEPLHTDCPGNQKVSELQISSPLPLNASVIATTRLADSHNGLTAHGINCNEDNCLRALMHEGKTDATSFCQTFTTATATDLIFLPTYASQCTGETISRMSSACSCYIPCSAVSPIISAVPRPIIKISDGQPQAPGPSIAPSPPPMIETLSTSSWVRPTSDTLNTLPSLPETSPSVTWVSETALPIPTSVPSTLATVTTKATDATGSK